MASGSVVFFLSIPDSPDNFLDMKQQLTRRFPMRSTFRAASVLATACAFSLVTIGCGKDAEPSKSATPSATPPAALPAKATAPVVENKDGGKQVTATATATVNVAPKPTETAGADPAKVRLDGTTPGDLVPAFVAAGTQSGAPATLDSHKPGAVTVYTIGSTSCPYTNKYAGKMGEVEAAYAPKGVKFVWLYSNRTESDADKTAWHAEKKLGGLFVIDKDAAIARALAAERTPEIVVTSADGTIVYRGAIDDGAGDPKRAKAQYLSDALDATLSGKEVTTPATTPAG